jgi:hypothetical protein
MEYAYHATSRVLHAWGLQGLAPPAQMDNFCSIVLVIITVQGSIQTESALLLARLDFISHLNQHAVRAGRPASNAVAQQNAPNAPLTCTLTWGDA